MATIESTPTINHADYPTRKRRLLQVSADSAILVLLFSTMFSSWALAAVAGALLIGLFLYAWLWLHQPERNAFVIRTVVACMVAGGVASGVAMFSR